MIVSCTEEVLVKDWSYASLGAAEGLAHRMREMIGLDAAGAELAMATKTDRTEQTGFANSVRGIFGTATPRRTTPAHLDAATVEVRAPAAHDR